MATRITNSALYRNYTSSVNDVHTRLNKSMNKVSSGKAYEAAQDNPLAYYTGMRLDNEYQETVSKKTLLTDIQKRLYQQELGVRSIQSSLTTGKDNAAARISYILNETNNTTPTAVDTIRSDLIQKSQSMVDALNAKYENFYVFGGNDLSTTPFSLSYNEDHSEMTLQYNHKFPGEDNATTFEFKLSMDSDGKFSCDFTGDDNKLITAMKEQGRVDVGYGAIAQKDSLIDTYTGGLNLLTGLTSDTTFTKDDVINGLMNSAIGLTGKAVITMSGYIDNLNNEAGGISKSVFQSNLGDVLDEIDTTSHKLSSVYSDLGNKYSLLDTTADRLAEKEINLQDQYRNWLGADPYQSIIEMYSHQQSYSAALRVSSNIMRTSLFDFMS